MVADTKGRILLVEDEAPLREVFVKALERSGWSVLAYGTAAEALGELSLAPESFEAVVADISLPDFAGRDLLVSRIREVAPRAPLLLMSGSPLPFSLPLRSAFLQKPFGLGRLLEAVNDLQRGETEVGPSPT